MNCVFVCYVDPTIFLKDSHYTFSQKEVADIAELTDEYMMNDSYAMKMLEKYDSPFWFISSVYDNIKLEIHAVMSETNSETVAKEFNNKVVLAIETLMGKGATKLS